MCSRPICAQNLAGRVAHGLSERWGDWRLGIRTIGYETVQQAGIENVDSIGYVPSPYAAFWKTMRYVGARPETSVFVDYGAGYGRIVCCAATLPFKRVIGVELAASHVNVARENIKRAANRLRCQSVKVAHADAAHWRVPDDASVFHLYNPFTGRTLQTVSEEIARSLRENRRRVWIMFANAFQMDSIMRSGKIIPYAWRVHTYSVRWPFYRDVSVRDRDMNRYHVYVIDSRGPLID